jgi:hypothetical protein
MALNCPLARASSWTRSSDLCFRRPGGRPAGQVLAGVAPDPPRRAAPQRGAGALCQHHFAGRHQKAADYTVAKARFGLLELALARAVLLGWTLLGGLDALNRRCWAGWARGMLQQLALLGLHADRRLIDLPFTLYQTFVHRSSASASTR